MSEATLRNEPILSDIGYEPLRAAVAALTSVCDYASTEDGQGWNGTDTWLGHALAAMPATLWDADAAFAAWDMTRKYRRQLEGFGIIWGELPVPEDAADRLAERRREAREGTRNAIKERARVAAIKAKSYVSCSGEGETVIMAFPYDRDMVFASRQIHGRAYRDSFEGHRKVNIYPFAYLPEVIEFADKYGLTVPPEVRALGALADSYAKTEAAKAAAEAAKVAAGPQVYRDGTKTVIIVRADFDAKLNEALRELNSGRSTWDSEHGVHKPPYRRDPQALLDLVEKFKLRMDDIARELIEGEVARQERNAAAAVALHGEPMDIPGLAPGTALKSLQFPVVRYAIDNRRIIVGDDMGFGKEQPVSEPVLTPTGWRPIGEVRPGDDVIGKDGRATKVLRVFPQGVKDVYRVTFNDKSSTRAGIDHLWEVRTGNDFTRGTKRVLSTRELIDNGLRDGATNRKYRIPLVSPVEFGEAGLPLDPYLLGILIGDGAMKTSVMLTTADEEIRAEVEARLPEGTVLKSAGRYDYRIVGTRHHNNPVLNALRELGLFGHGSESKFIPVAYMLGSVRQREALLQGLIDTDGHVGQNNQVEYVTVSPQLAKDTVALVQSLGGVARTITKASKQKASHRLAYRIHLCMPNHVLPVRLSRKAAAYRPRTKYFPTRLIESIEPEGREESVCLLVEAKDHLYVTRDYVVTHNTLSSLAAVAVDGSLPAVVVCRPSLTLNWEKEIRQFFPGWKVFVAEGTTPQEIPEGTDVVVIGSAGFAAMPRPPKALSREELGLVRQNGAETVPAARAGAAIRYLLALPWFGTFKGISDLLNIPEAELRRITEGEDQQVTRAAEYNLMRFAKPGREKVFPWVDVLVKFAPKALILDEGQDAKEQSANRSQAVELLARPVIKADGLVLDLTGTAIVNRPKELLQQLKILKRESAFGGAGAYLMRYCAGEANAYGTTFDGAHNLIELNQRLLRYGIMIRRTDPKALGLPEFREHVWEIPQGELDPAAMEKYEAAEADVIEFLGAEAERLAKEMGVDPASARVRAAMKASAAEHLVRLNALRKLIGEAKRPAVSAWLREQIAKGEKVMVAGHHRPVVSGFAKEFGGLKIQGEQPTAAKEADKARFQNEPIETAPVISVAIAAGGVGHTLTAARVGIQAEVAWTPGDTAQMGKRLHRIGQTRDVDYTVAIVPGTVDEEIWDVVVRKRAILAAALDGIEDEGADENPKSVVADVAWAMAQKGLRP